MQTAGGFSTQAVRVRHCLDRLEVKKVALRWAWEGSREMTLPGAVKSAKAT